MKSNILVVSVPAVALFIACHGQTRVDPSDGGATSDAGATIDAGPSGCSPSGCDGGTAPVDAGAGADGATLLGRDDATAGPDGAPSDSGSTPDGGRVPDGSSPDASDGSVLSACREPGVITQFAISASNSSPVEIVGGSDGNLWFTDPGTSSIGRITMAGVVTEFPLTAGMGPETIAAGPDGNLWAAGYDTNTANADSNGTQYVWRITTAGVITSYTLSSLGLPMALTAGPDGNLWMTSELYDNYAVTQIFLDGGSTPFSVPAAPPGVDAGNESPWGGGIVAGPDGNLWFGGASVAPGARHQWVGEITPMGAVTQILLPVAAGRASYPSPIAVGADGNLWVGAGASVYDAGAQDFSFWRVTPSGVATEFPVSFPVSGPNVHHGFASNQMARGPDNQAWFVADTAIIDGGLATELGSWLGRVSSTGVVETFPSLYASGAVAGPDGNLWATTSVMTPDGGSAGYIERITLDGPCKH